MTNRMSVVMGLATVSLGASFGSGINSYPSRRDWSHITHTYSEKPLTKRQKRRLRGKGKEPT